MKRYFLIGPRACGKTTLGKLLARAMKCGCVDTDAVLLERLGTTIADFVAANGWERFRDEESLALEGVIRDTEGEGRVVVSTGGGIVLRPENRKLIRESGVTLYLSVAAEELARRLARDAGDSQRPSLTGKPIADEVREILAARDPLYRETATLVVGDSFFDQTSCGPLLEVLDREGLLS